MRWVVLSALAVLSVALSAVAQEAGSRPEIIARNLAENVLGEGTVRSVRVVAEAGQIHIVWDAVLYRSAHTRARNREQLRGEAELATGSIMGVMKPRLIRFTMMLGRRVLAQGTRTPGEFTITFAKDLDG